jgi:antitoxin HigA-1
MVRNRMRPIHPGEILKEEFMRPMHMSAYALANNLSVPTNRITAIINEQRGVTGDTAIRLSLFYGTSIEFWMNLQKTYEIRKAEIEFDEKLKTVIASNADGSHQNQDASK